MVFIKPDDLVARRITAHSLERWLKEFFISLVRLSVTTPFPQIALIVDSKSIHSGRFYLLKPFIFVYFRLSPGPRSIGISASNHVVIRAETESLFDRFTVFIAEDPNIVIKIARPDFLSFVALSQLYHLNLKRVVRLRLFIRPNIIIKRVVQAGAAGKYSTLRCANNQEVLSAIA